MNRLKLVQFRQDMIGPSTDLVKAGKSGPHHFPYNNVSQHFVRIRLQTLLSLQCFIALAGASWKLGNVLAS